MKTAANTQDNRPDDAAIRAQVERMTASTVFQNSPQLASFLMFVVEALLRGRSERLKGYTIGVEVLRRDVSFDPQVDPIVRVEATRLRRAIDRYYAGPGADDAVTIALPRGGYVPRIAWRAVTPAAPAPESEALAPGNGMPTLRVAPFVVIGTPGPMVIDSETLSGKLCEAFALFDMINVIGAAPNANGRIDYRLDGTLEYRGDDTVCLRFRLVDKSDETVIWSHTFEAEAGENPADIERKLIRDLSTSIVQRFGIIWSHERARQFVANVGDPRHRALIQAGESLRSFDLTAYERARSELERLTEIDPGFAAGFTYLGLFNATDYVHGLSEATDDASALDRALKLARRGVELKPHSAFAYHILFVIMFFRGETEAACAAAEKAIALNPNDVIILADYGGRLIFSGQVDRGIEILNRTVAFGAVLPSWAHFYMFLGHYLREELPEARFHASQMTSESHFYGRLARALMAHRDGQADEARRAVAAIVSDQARWSVDPRREIGKLIIDPAIADRLTRDLAAAGLRAPDEAGRRER